MNEFLNTIEKLSEEVERRTVQKHGDTYMQATKAEVHALRTLATHLVHIFGAFPNVDFGGEGE